MTESFSVVGAFSQEKSKLSLDDIENFFNDYIRDNKLEKVPEIEKGVACYCHFDNEHADEAAKMALKVNEYINQELE